MTFTGDMTSGFTVQAYRYRPGRTGMGLLAVGQLSRHLSLRLNYDAFLCDLHSQK